jgi:hypothetical protein
MRSECDMVLINLLRITCLGLSARMFCRLGTSNAGYENPFGAARGADGYETPNFGVSRAALLLDFDCVSSKHDEPQPMHLRVVPQHRLLMRCTCDTLQVRAAAPPAAADTTTEVDTICKWINAVTSKKVDSTDLHASLRTGEVLCVLINKLQPGSVRKPHTGRSAIKQRKNIADFLEGAQLYGVHPRDLFDVDDLFGDDDMLRVLLSLVALKKCADDRSK